MKCEEINIVPLKNNIFPHHFMRLGTISPKDLELPPRKNLPHPHIMTHHHLTISRKRSRLTQRDVSYILNMKEPSTISRWEAGERDIPFEPLLVYYLLFNTPLKEAITHKITLVKETLKQRIPLLINELRMLESTPRIQRRILFLQEKLSTL